MTTRSLSIAGALALLVLSRYVCAHQIEKPFRSGVTIEDPGGRAMRAFHDSLRRTYQGEGVTRILHFGDSHVAAGILTGALRTEFRQWFGDAGVGFVLPGRPWPGYWRAGVSGQTSAGWRIDGLTRASLAADGRFGLGGVSLGATAPGEWITVTAAGSYFDIYFLKQPGGGSISVLLDGVEQKRNVSLVSSAGESACIRIVAGQGPVHTLEIRTVSSGRARIFGVAIESNSAGVIYDALGINGARASRPLLWDWRVLAGCLERRDPDLIIVAYGSNEVSDADLDIERYKVSFKTLLERFRDAAPRASMLVIGPPDRAVRIGGVWKSIARMTALVEAQRQAAFETGAAFYDLFKAMGGSGSIERLAVQPRPLAQPDRVHFTSAGYGLVGHWLYSGLMSGYLQAISAPTLMSPPRPLE